LFQFFKLKNLLFLTNALLTLQVFGQSNLPPCVGAYSAEWNNCFGTYNYPGGSRYVGEWRGAKRSGQGTNYFAEYQWRGDKYAGEWRDDRINGFGTYTWANGNQYVGQWRDAKRSGQGTFTIAGDGPKQSGSWVNDQFQGVVKISSQPIPDTSNRSNENSKATAIQENPQVVSPSKDSERRKKCQRMGLMPGSEDYNFCIKSR